MSDSSNENYSVDAFSDHVSDQLSCSSYLCDEESDIKKLVRHKKYCLFSLNLNTLRKRFCNSRWLARGMAVAWRFDNKTPTGCDFSCIVIKNLSF
jgi:hypothetical protein